MNYLGSFNPFYLNQTSGPLICEKFSEAFSKAKTIEYDEVAVVELLSLNYILANRTPIKSIRRVPWMSTLVDGEFLTSHLFPHSDDTPELSEIGKRLFELLCEEVLEYVRGHTKVGLLLSGGMDSRIVAGVLYHLISTRQLKDLQIVTFTWGLSDCRDVVYAQKISELFNWQFRHYKVEFEDLWKNIEIAGRRGCEYSGFHLHALPKIASDSEDIDVFLAGSYGDSVGRAEFSGVHVTNLKPIISRVRKNPFGLLKASVTRNVKTMIGQDISYYRSRFKRNRKFEYNEMEMQAHYMRRMLNPCMEVIKDTTPIHQVFTKPSVYSFMWGLSTKKRNDEIYKELLDNHLDQRLGHIPWSRTGLPYLSLEGQPDRLKKSHHNYEEFVEEKLVYRIEERLKNVNYLGDTFFNEFAVRKILEIVKQKKGHNFDLLERLIWLVSFTYFMEAYPENVNRKHQSSILDALQAQIVLSLKWKATWVLRKHFR